MQSRSSPYFWIPVLSGIGVLLVILGTLQYRWSTQIKRVSEVRVAADLESVMIKWHLDFFGEFSNVCVALQIGPDSGERDSWEDYLHRYSQWGKVASEANLPEHLYANRDLVHDIYIWETSRASDPRLERLDAEKEKIETSEVPADLQALLTHLRRNSSNLRTALRAWAGGVPDGTYSSAQETSSPSHSLRSNAEIGWQFDEHVPALVHPIFHYTHHGAVDTKALRNSDPVDWVVVVLNLETIQNRVLPDLMQRFFNGPHGLEYKAAVITRGPATRVLYSSDPGFGIHVDSQSDAVMDIFGPSLRMPSKYTSPPTSAGSQPDDWRRFSSPVWFPVIRQTATDGPWALVLQNRHGRFDAAVNQVWRSNLLTGGVVLLLLAASMVLVVIASQHAHKLANLQMDFVASVSHELRTPLSVILSAGENIRDGLLEGRKAFMEQGAVVAEQANALMELVDQVLRFASLSEAVSSRQSSAIQVTTLIDLALRNTSEMLEKGPFEVEKRISTDLPPVVGDLQGLTQSLQNLIINAVKYSERHRWLGISAESGVDLNGRPEVRISVADRGIGIASSELTQIFQPFYRSPRVVAAHIRGTGLGLSLAKRNAEAFGGHLSVISDLGIGSVFTLHLPLAEEQAAQLPMVETKTTS